MIDMRGQRYGSLVALEPDYSRKSSNLYWWFQCDCGKKVSIMGKSVRKGITSSCGCLKECNWLGQRVGLLTVIEKTTQRSNRAIVWKCQCDCGNIVYVNSRDLHRQSVVSCGCQKISLGEAAIEQLLIENNISYEREYKFNNCRFLDTNMCARFDFYVNNTYLIEFDGIGHYKQIDFFGDDIAYQKQQEHDLFKNNWCHQMNIPLIRIPYWHLKDLKIEDLQLETSSFLI